MISSLIYPTATTADWLCSLFGLVGLDTETTEWQPQLKTDSVLSKGER